MGRPTEEKKGKTVILRVSDELHGWLKKQADMDEKSLSEYIRGLLAEKAGSKNELGKSNVIQKNIGKIHFTISNFFH